MVKFQLYTGIAPWANLGGYTNTNPNPGANHG